MSVVSLTMAMALTAAACGSDKKAADTTVAAATETTAAATETTAAAETTIAAATETTAAAAAETTVAATATDAAGAITAAMAAPTFTLPDGYTPIDLTKVKGKKVVIVSLVQSVPIVAQWAAEVTTALDGTGVSVETFDGKFDPNEWVRGIEQAISNKADAILLLGIPPKAVGPQVSDAKKAGIPIIASLQGYAGLTKGDFPDLSADIGFDYRVPGKLMGDWFASDSGGKGNAIIFTSDDNTSSPFVSKAMIDEIKAMCPGCKYKVEDAPVPTWGDGTLQQRTKALVAADPSITHILAVYDAMTLAIEPGLVEAGVADKIRVAGFNGTPAVLANVKKGTAVKMDVGNPNMWFSASAADGILRALSGGTIVEDAGVPFRVFTKENLADVDTSKEDPVNWYGIDPLAGFRKVWGL